MKEAEEFCPKNQDDWRNWLEQYHQEKDAVWLIFHKKTSPKHNLTWSESVDQALCFGWIDSTKRTIDKDRYKQYFSKRKAKSIWSKINKEKVDLLIDNGLMTEAGYKSIALAKENGSWNSLDGLEEQDFPQELKLAMHKHPVAKNYIENLSKSAKKNIIYWLMTAKRAETREKRIIEVVENANQNQMPKPFRA